MFIAHALPGYLLGAETSAAESASKEIIEQITPSEAVEYVLPLLNGLAMDEGALVVRPITMFCRVNSHARFFPALKRDNGARSLFCPPC